MRQTYILGVRGFVTVFVPCEVRNSLAVWFFSPSTVPVLIADMRVFFRGTSLGPFVLQVASAWAAQSACYYAISVWDRLSLANSKKKLKLSDTEIEKVIIPNIY